MSEISDPANEGQHECQRCGSDKWSHVDYGGCSVCNPLRFGPRKNDEGQQEAEVLRSVIWYAENRSGAPSQGHVALASLLASLARVIQEREQYRIEADCGLRDYDALELKYGTLVTALQEIADAALVQHAKWMHFHEDAIANPFAAESQAQAYAAKVSQLARVALASVAE